MEVFAIHYRIWNEDLSSFSLLSCERAHFQSPLLSNLLDNERCIGL
jgi:hypothetical protein